MNEKGQELALDGQEPAAVASDVAQSAAELRGIISSLLAAQTGSTLQAQPSEPSYVDQPLGKGELPPPEGQEEGPSGGDTAGMPLAADAASGERQAPPKDELGASIEDVEQAPLPLLASGSACSSRSGESAADWGLDAQEQQGAPAAVETEPSVLSAIEAAALLLQAQRDGLRLVARDGASQRRPISPAARPADECPVPGSLPLDAGHTPLLGTAGPSTDDSDAPAGDVAAAAEPVDAPAGQPAHQQAGSSSMLPASVPAAADSAAGTGGEARHTRSPFSSVTDEQLSDAHAGQQAGSSLGAAADAAAEEECPSSWAVARPESGRSVWPANSAELQVHGVLQELAQLLGPAALLQAPEAGTGDGQQLQPPQRGRSMARRASARPSAAQASSPAGVLGSDRSSWLLAGVVRQEACPPRPRRQTSEEILQHLQKVNASLSRCSSAAAERSLSPGAGRHASFSPGRGRFGAAAEAAAAAELAAGQPKVEADSEEGPGSAASMAPQPRVSTFTVPSHNPPQHARPSSLRYESLLLQARPSCSSSSPERGRQRHQHPSSGACSLPQWMRQQRCSSAPPCRSSSPAAPATCHPSNSPALAAWAAAREAAAASPGGGAYSMQRHSAQRSSASPPKASQRSHQDPARYPHRGSSRGPASAGGSATVAAAASPVRMSHISLWGAEGHGGAGPSGEAAPGMATASAAAVVAARAEAPRQASISLGQLLQGAAACGERGRSAAAAAMQLPAGDAQGVRLGRRGAPGGARTSTVQLSTPGATPTRSPTTQQRQATAQRPGTACSMARSSVAALAAVQGASQLRKSLGQLAGSTPPSTDPLHSSSSFKQAHARLLKAWGVPAAPASNHTASRSARPRSAAASATGSSWGPPRREASAPSISALGLRPGSGGAGSSAGRLLRASHSSCSPRHRPSQGPSGAGVLHAPLSPLRSSLQARPSKVERTLSQAVAALAAAASHHPGAALAPAAGVLLGRSVSAERPSAWGGALQRPPGWHAPAKVPTTKAVTPVFATDLRAQERLAGCTSPPTAQRRQQCASPLKQAPITDLAQRQPAQSQGARTAAAAASPAAPAPTTPAAAATLAAPDACVPAQSGKTGASCVSVAVRGSSSGSEGTVGEGTCASVAEGRPVSRRASQSPSRRTSIAMAPVVEGAAAPLLESADGSFANALLMTYVALGKSSSPEQVGRALQALRRCTRTTGDGLADDPLVQPPVQQPVQQAVQQGPLQQPGLGALPSKRRAHVGRLATPAPPQHAPLQQRSPKVARAPSSPSSYARLAAGRTAGQRGKAVGVLPAAGQVPHPAAGTSSAQDSKAASGLPVSHAPHLLGDALLHRSSTTPGGRSAESEAAAVQALLLSRSISAVEGSGSRGTGEAGAAAATAAQKPRGADEAAAAAPPAALGAAQMPSGVVGNGGGDSAGMR